jgi:hypothetical protein
MYLPPPGANGGTSSDCDDDLLEQIVPFLSLCAIGNDVVQWSAVLHRKTQVWTAGWAPLSAVAEEDLVLKCIE